jgi:hypothetical protein
MFQPVFMAAPDWKHLTMDDVMVTGNYGHG